MACSLTPPWIRDLRHKVPQSLAGGIMGVAPLVRTNGPSLNSPQSYVLRQAGLLNGPGIYRIALARRIAVEYDSAGHPGEVTERPIVLVSKTSVGETSPRVRIPPSPL